MELGKLVASFEADTRKFDGPIRTSMGHLGGFERQLGGMRGLLGSVSSALTGFASPAALATGGAVALSSAISATAAGLFQLIKNSAEAGGELHDLSEKTNFAVETLSGLSVAGKKVGADIKGIANSLVIFETNMVKARDKTSEMGKTFAELNIATIDQEKALRQAMKALFDMGATEDQAARAKQLFGKAGKDVLGIIKETNGNLDKAIAKYDKMGLVISTSAAAASDKFNDLLEETTLQLNAVTRSIGMELLPVATDALTAISARLQANKDEWSAWGKSISNVTRGLSVVVHSEFGHMMAQIGAFGFKWLSLTGLIAQGLGALGSANAPREDFFGPGGAARGGRKTLPGTPEYVRAQELIEARRKQLADMGLSGGGGGGKGGGAGRTDPGVDLLKQLQEQLAGLIPKTEGQKAEQALLNKEFDKTPDAIKKQIQITAADIDAQTMVLAITRQRTVATITLREEMEKLAEVVRAAGAAGLEFFSRRRTMKDITDLDLFDLGGGSKRVREDPTTRRRSIADGATRARFATLEMQALHDEIEKITDAMRGLGHDLTSAFSYSVETGIREGGKRGLATFGLELARIVERNFLEKIATGLGEMLSGTATGGGFWAGLLKAFGFSALSGGLTGGFGGGPGGGLGAAAAGAIGRDSGGPIWPGQLFKVHKDELIVPTQPGFVIPKSGMGQQQVVHNHYNTFNIKPAGGASYNSPKSGRQQAEQIVALLQTQLV